MRSMASMMSACGNTAMPIPGSSQLRVSGVESSWTSQLQKGNSQFSHFQWVGKSSMACFFFGLIWVLWTKPMNRRLRKGTAQRSLTTWHWPPSPGPWASATPTCLNLPAAIEVENSIFCVHGGLSPDVRSSKTRIGRISRLGWISPKILWSNQQVHIPPQRMVCTFGTCRKLAVFCSFTRKVATQSLPMSAGEGAGSHQNHQSSAGREI